MSVDVLNSLLIEQGVVSQVHLSCLFLADYAELVIFIKSFIITELSRRVQQIHRKGPCFKR